MDDGNVLIYIGNIPFHKFKNPYFFTRSVYIFFKLMSNHGVLL